MAKAKKAKTAKKVTIRLTLPRFRSYRNSALSNATPSVAILTQRGTGMSANVAARSPMRRSSQVRVATSVPSHVSGDVAAMPRLTAEEVRERMSGNICRCGAYPNIVAAIAAVAR